MSRRTMREATAYHEAGHVVAAWKLGVRLRSATVIPSEGSHGTLKHDNPLRGINLEFDGSDRARLKAEKGIIIALAGPAAQRHFAPRSWRFGHGAADRECAVDLAWRLNGSGEMVAKHLAYLQARAEGLVEGSWRFVEALARALLEHGRLDQTALGKVIEAEIETATAAQLPAHIAFPRPSGG